MMDGREFVMHSVLVLIGVVVGVVGQAIVSDWQSDREKDRHVLSVYVFPSSPDQPHEYVAYVSNDGNVTERGIVGEVTLSITPGGSIEVDKTRYRSNPEIIESQLTLVNDDPQPWDHATSVQITIPRMNPGDNLYIWFTSTTDAEYLLGTFQSEATSAEHNWWKTT